MSNTLSKLCADFLRQSQNKPGNVALKATHAHELVAAFFGYKSHAALLTDSIFPVDKLSEAQILIPDVAMIEERRLCLQGLPIDLPSSYQMAEMLSKELKNNGAFLGEVWLCDSLETYAMEELLPQSGSYIENELASTMAETNAAFEDGVYYTRATVSENGDETSIEADGICSGITLDDKPFCGDKIDVKVLVSLPRVAGHIGFREYSISSVQSGVKNWDETADDGEDAVSPKDQFIGMTGGFVFGETQQQFQQRQDRINALRIKIAQGQGDGEDVADLSRLLGHADEDL